MAYSIILHISGEPSILGEIEEYEFGKFGRFMDPDGNKVELWELPASGQ